MKLSMHPAQNLNKKSTASRTRRCFFIKLPLITPAALADQLLRDTCTTATTHGCASLLGSPAHLQAERHSLEPFRRFRALPLNSKSHSRNEPSRTASLQSASFQKALGNHCKTNELTS